LIKHGFGQLSIEYLLIAAAVLSLLAVLAVSFNSVLFSGLFVLDVQNAKTFLFDLQKKSESLSFYGEGSFASTQISFFNEWRIYSSEGFLLVEVSSKRLGVSKTLRVSPSVKVVTDIPQTKNKLHLRLSREKDFVLIKNNQPDS